LQKFSLKGWVCKTYEGELAQYVVAGMTPQIWSFSVRDEAAARELEKNVGARVQLHYTEHAGVPSSCFAETRYFVDGLTVIDSGVGAPPVPKPAAPAAPVPAVPASPAPGAAAPPGTTPPPAAPAPIAPPAPPSS
jgi:hypothetical protein